MYQGKQYQRSTGCPVSSAENKRLAEAILGKVKTKIIEGRFFDVLEEREAVTVLDQSYDKIMTVAKASQETNGRTF
jgi:hypothetical protein